MTYDQYKEKISEMVSKPDEAALIATDILNELKNDTDVISSLTAETATKDERIRSLQETVAKQYNLLTGTPAGNDSPDNSWMDNDLSEDQALELFKQQISGGK